MGKSVVATDDQGRRWRKCAAAAIVNGVGQILVGERIKIKGSWNTPQGGLEDGESALAAATREAEEEVGLVVGKHILPVAAMDDAAAVRYEAGGWLAKAGFAGQQLHWSLFTTKDPVLDVQACDLSGGGEAPEFSRVEWRSIDAVVEGIWAPKRAPYEAMRAWVLPQLVALRQKAEGGD